MRERILRFLMASNSYTSGEALSRELGVSRTAVWKVINKLKEEGYKIDSIRNKGYKLMEETEGLYEESIRVNLPENSRFRTVKIYETVDSTITEAKRLKMDGKMNEGLIIAQQQTDGKGRRGRTWVSSDEKGIWMSMLLTPDIPPSKASMLTLLAGLSVVEAIKTTTALKAQIKWPNDIVINGKKVCGILTEMSAQLDYINYVVVGIGINVNHSQMDESIAEIASSLKMITGSSVSRMALLTQVLQSFEALYDSFIKTMSLDFVIEAYNEACINVGMALKVESYGEVRYGRGVRVDSEGQLIVAGDDGESFSVNAGEVSVRGLYGYAQ